MLSRAEMSRVGRTVLNAYFLPKNWIGNRTNQNAKAVLCIFPAFEVTDGGWKICDPAWSRETFFSRILRFLLTHFGSEFDCLRSREFLFERTRRASRALKILPLQERRFSAARNIKKEMTGWQKSAKFCYQCQEARSSTLTGNTEWWKWKHHLR